MTSRTPYCFGQTKKRWPYWILLILNSFPRDVTVAILVWLSKDIAAILYLICMEKKNAFDVTTAMVVW